MTTELQALLKYKQEIIKIFGNKGKTIEILYLVLSGD